MASAETTQTVNETKEAQIVNRFIDELRVITEQWKERYAQQTGKLSNQEKAILEYLANPTNWLHDRTSKEITFYLLSRKYGKTPFNHRNYYNWSEGSYPEGFEPRWEDQFIYAESRLPHFIAQLENGDPKKLTLEEIFDFQEGPGYFRKTTRKDLLKKANSVRASVCRSLKRLMERGLIVSLTVTKAYGMIGNRIPSQEKTYYFISKEQGKKIIHSPSESFCNYDAHFLFKKEAVS